MLLNTTAKYTIMASKMVTVFMKNRKRVEIPESNIHNFKRLFHGLIDYIQEDEGAPIIAKPVIEEIKKPNVEAVKGGEANDTMTKKVLQDMATAKGIEFKGTTNKADLIALINA